jgi:DNA (cytosine-5)-methyltransferase 1
VTFGSLFAGIGGMDLGLERAGMRCAWQVEIDDYARRVLARHWPDVRRWDDVRTFPPDVANAESFRYPNDDAGLDSQTAQQGAGRVLESRGGGPCSAWSVDLICGGFPCQDISYAGKGAGLAGERSGLWYEFARIVRVLRPRYVLVENVAALLGRGLDAVLRTLASLGYDAEWHCIPAAAVGAPHIRDRVFVVANAAGVRFAQSNNESRHNGFITPTRKRGMFKSSRADSHLRDPDLSGLAQRLCFGSNAREKLTTAQRANSQAGGQWGADPADDPQSGVGRVAHGVPNRVDRLRGLGNAVVPQVAEWIGRWIMEHAEAAE